MYNILFKHSNFFCKIGIFILHVKMMKSQLIECE